MAITPINITRVSHNLRTMSMLDSLRRNSLDLFNQQNRLATGRSFVSASDNPVAATQSLRMRDELSRQGQILDNLRHADLMLGSADNALNEVNDLLIEAESIATRSVGAQANADEREANAALIASIRDRLVAIGNRNVNGSFIFAGRDTQNAPFTTALGGVAFTGDTGDVLARVSTDQQQSINVPGSVIFGALSTAIGPMFDLAPALTRDTRLEDLAGANNAGIRKGGVVLVAADGTSASVDLTQADTVGDVIDLIENAAQEAGLTATVTIDNDALVLAGNVTVHESGDGRTARDLGLAADAEGTAPDAPVSLNPRVAANTLIESLNAGTGVPLDEGITLTNGGQSAVVDLSSATTVQDVLNAINTAGVFVNARINAAGTGIEIVSQVSGPGLSVSENGGTTAASLALRPFDEDTPLSSLNFGRGVEMAEGVPDLRITAKDGSTFDVNLDGAETTGDVVTMINDAAATAGVGIQATLNADTNAIQLDDTTGGADPLSVSRADIASFAVDDLGLLKTAADGETSLASDNVSQTRADGVFTVLIDLEDALRADDERRVLDAAERITQFSDNVTREHGVVGARAAQMRERVDQTENAVIATQSFLSEIEDLDYTEAVTRFQQAQTALQANLQSGAQLLNLSLLDFLG